MYGFNIDIDAYLPQMICTLGNVTGHMCHCQANCATSAQVKLKYDRLLIQVVLLTFQIRFDQLQSSLPLCQYNDFVFFMA